jgi:hypothetical protein
MVLIALMILLLSLQARVADRLSGEPAAPRGGDDG